MSREPDALEKKEPTKPSPSPKDETHDVVFLHSKTADGKGIRALRARPGRVDLTEIRPIKEGKPISSEEIVSLHPREESPLIWDVETKYKPEPVGTSTTDSQSRIGPGQVASNLYRQNWETIFGKVRKKSAREKHHLN